jgi:hypothetical protein
VAVSADVQKPVGATQERRLNKSPPQAAELNAKVARIIIEAMRHILEIMVLSSSLFLACVRLSSPELPFGPTRESSFGLLVSVSLSLGS